MTDHIEDPLSTHQRSASQTRRPRQLAAGILLGGGQWLIHYAWKFLLTSATVVLRPGTGPTLMLMALAILPDAVIRWVSRHDTPDTVENVSPTPHPSRLPAETRNEGQEEVLRTVLRIKTIDLGSRTETWATLAEQRQTVPREVEVPPGPKRCIPDEPGAA